ncbi:AAA family ATPase [Rothia kristinae]|uniref:AAA family ATPase n=1 Tax=Rothia kristinae TaxID=37923 RepID=UPI00244AB829|nr:AAA family ATPase [Rothia kristinae]WGH09981.1 AAA family ATPase [Rothia kristinae]
MLRRLKIEKSWRSFNSHFWPDDLPLGRKTVIYGHNGSGKSTFSELLLDLSEGGGATDVAWEDESMHITKVPTGTAAPSPSISVFTRRWIEANLSAFLEGRNASAIVTLGKAAIDAKADEKKLTDELVKLKEAAAETDRQEAAAKKNVEVLARNVQNEIVSQLQAFDYTHFTKSRYSINRVKNDLRSYHGEYPSSDDHAASLKLLGENAPSSLNEVAAPPSNFKSELDSITEILARTPTRVAIQTLDGIPTVQKWVEQGVSLHEGVDHCYFCDGKISNERRNQLALHFDESWHTIRGEVRDLQEAASRKRRDLELWRASFPQVSNLASEIQQVYAEALQYIDIDVKNRVSALESIERVLAEKSNDPSSTPEAQDWSVLSTDISATELSNAVIKHNDLVKRHAEITAKRQETVLNHLVSAQSADFIRLEREAQELATKKAADEKSVALTERRLSEVRQSQFTTKDMADTLTRDLSRVYGKDHLNVEVTSDGKSYICRRGNESATNLSDGERTTLALLYFLRTLQDEQNSDINVSERIVVIDDPSSSLDRESVFATHQWLMDTLKTFGQYIILTHDFSMLRLLLKSHKNAWGASLKKIGNNNSDEIKFPKVSFLEMYATSIGGKRSTRLGKLPDILLKNTSEYAYLFRMVMTGIRNPDDHERLFLLPNAARRVLEVFSSYKAPHRTDFLQQLEELVGSQGGERFRDVYDFCNRYSHGEGNESVDVLDARAVHRQIRRCMEFLRSVDDEHYQRMCGATDINPETVQ